MSRVRKHKIKVTLGLVIVTIAATLVADAAWAHHIGAWGSLGVNLLWVWEE